MRKEGAVSQAFLSGPPFVTVAALVLPGYSLRGISLIGNYKAHIDWAIGAISLDLADPCLRQGLESMMPTPFTHFHPLTSVYSVLFHIHQLK